MGKIVKKIFSNNIFKGKSGGKNRELASAEPSCAGGQCSLKLSTFTTIWQTCLSFVVLYGPLYKNK